jgi:hypothetical protein
MYVPTRITVDSRVATPVAVRVPRVSSFTFAALSQPQ